MSARGIRGHRLDPRILGDIESRLQDHLARIASVDWEYFAALRYRNDAKQAVSDLDRLIGHIRALERGPDFMLRDVP